MLSFFILNFRLASGDSGIFCNKENCPMEWIGDGFCDESCMALEWNYDSLLDSDSNYLMFVGSDCFNFCICNEEKLKNGICDPECDNYFCGYDLGDCGYCSSGCFEKDLESEICKPECNKSSCCYFERNPCFPVECAPGCLLSKDIYSDYCKENCLAKSCLEYENSTCGNLECAPNCNIKMKGDLLCQKECYNSDCNYDDGDCYCSSDCPDKSDECLTNETYTDPCDNIDCDFKDSKCGFCNSGCFKQHLGDGICQFQCNTPLCNYDNGDCGCGDMCSFRYDKTISEFIQIETVDRCDPNCLLIGCRFGIDFCTDKNKIKLSILNYLVNKNTIEVMNFHCGSLECNEENMDRYLNGTDLCEKNSSCNERECAFCLGQANINFENCLRQNFDECLLCNKSIVEIFCHNDLSECPTGYEDIQEIATMFGNPHWCLKEPTYYSKSNYKEIFVDSSTEFEGKDSYVKSLYKALVNVYAAYTKIFILNKEIDFFVDESSSIFVKDIYDPLNIKTLYMHYELWIIGNYSGTDKTKIYYKENIIISPIAKRFYLKNIEFIGKNVMYKDCFTETCFYCPYITHEFLYYLDDSSNIVLTGDYWLNYGKSCKNYFSVNVFNFSREAFIEDVNFKDFRFQFNSFIKSTSHLYLKNVNFYKMQAKPTGSIILIECIDDCISLSLSGNYINEEDCSIDCLETSFTYIQGLVSDIGAGYNDVENVKTGSFLKISGIGEILIKNITFSYNFAFINFRSSDKGYLIYSKNTLGTLKIEDCEFFSNYVNYLVYIDQSSQLYTEDRVENLISIDHSQQHFYMNNITIINTYCSKGVVYYLMENLANNIKIKNFLIKNSVVGEEGVLTFVKTGNLKESDIKGAFGKMKHFSNFEEYYIYFTPKFLILENIIIEDILPGKHALNIKGYPNSILKNISISNVRDTDADSNIAEIDEIIKSFRDDNETRHLSLIDKNTEKPRVNCNEMVLVSDSVNLLIDFMSITQINAISEKTPLGLSLYNIIEIANISGLILSNFETDTKSGGALKVTNSNIVNIRNLKIYNITNKDESVIKFENCNEVMIESIKISDVNSHYTSTFIVSNSGKFTLRDFLFLNMSSNYNSGGCLSLITGIIESSFKIQSGNFTKCSAKKAFGGALHLGSLGRDFETLFQIYDVGISESQSFEGSAIFISNNVGFNTINDSEIVGLFVNENSCAIGGTISDYHYSGNLKYNGLEMIKNNQGIYVSYANENIELSFFNSKIDASDCLKSAFYLISNMQSCLVHFENLDIFGSKIAIEAFNLKLSMNLVKIFNNSQAFYFNDGVECEAKELKIINTLNKALILEKNCYFGCYDCEFINNNDSIIEASINSIFKFFDSQITSNTLNSEYLLILSSGGSSESYLINCKIFSNLISSRILIYLTSSSLTLENTDIIVNEGFSSKIVAINLLNSKLDLFGSEIKFKSSVDSGVFFHAESMSRITAQSTIFKNSKSDMGNIYGNNVDIKIYNCTFLGNTGGDILTLESNLTIIDSYFENSSLLKSYSGVLEFRGNYYTKIEGSIFKNISTNPNLKNIAYVFDKSSSKLDILNCTFTESRGFFMALYAEDTASIAINNSKFKGFYTQDYSALTSISNGNGLNFSIIDSHITENWSGKNGGGVYSRNYDLMVENTEISSNKAKDSGGGIYYESPNCDFCGFYLIGNTKIFNNSCEGDGGAIKWKDYKPFIDENILLYNNSAAYGADLASTPANYGLYQGRRLSNSLLTTISAVPPGKEYKESIQILIFDTYGNIVETENSLTATLLINENENSIITISGKTNFEANNGILNITGFILTGVPGSSSSIKLKSDNMISSVARNYENEYSDSAFLKIEFRNCTRGEQIQGMVCADCIGGKYTLQASENCLSCPTGATCTGGDKIIVNNGYWRSSLESDVIYTCDIFDACQKGTESEELGSCTKGYTGVLCKSCEIGYSKRANGICTKCANEKINYALIIVFCFAFTFISFILVKTTIDSAFSSKSLHSIYIKIFTNYLQLVVIVTQSELEWPPYAKEFFYIQRSAASISDQLFSFDCFVSFNNSENIYFTKLLLISLIPIVIVAVSYLYWIFHGGILDSFKFLKREVYTTLIVLFFLVYPTIVNVMFSNFSCIEIDKLGTYLNENTSIVCWNSNHKKYSFIIAIPSIILWALGVPTILLLLMTKNRKRLHLDYYRVVLGFLYNGYKTKRFYWEINIMYRKIILITITVFKVSQVRVLQALNLIIVLLASIYLHHSYKPYNSNELNRMEMHALSVATLTIYFGLYYLSKSIDSYIQILLFTFIILGNSYFMLYWIYYMTGALTNIFIKYFPVLKPLFKRGDAFDEDFNKEEYIRQGVNFNRQEGKNAYTFLNLKKENSDEEFKYRKIEDAFRAVAKKDIKNYIIKEEEEKENLDSS